MERWSQNQTGVYIISMEIWHLSFAVRILQRKSCHFNSHKLGKNSWVFFFKQAFFSEFKIFDISYCNAAVGHSKGFLPPRPMTHKVTYLFAVPNTSLRSSVFIRKTLAIQKHVWDQQPACLCGVQVINGHFLFKTQTQSVHKSWAITTDTLKHEGMHGKKGWRVVLAKRAVQPSNETSAKPASEGGDSCQ